MESRCLIEIQGMVICKRSLKMESEFLRHSYTIFADVVVGRSPLAVLAMGILFRDTPIKLERCIESTPFGARKPLQNGEFS